MLPTNRQSHRGTGELQASTAQLRSIIGALPDAAFVIDKNGSVCFVNPAALDLFNLPADSLLGKPFAFGLSPDKVKQIQITRPRIKNVIAEMRTVETKWSGQPAYLVLLRDITERVSTEQALGESEERSQALLHAFPDMLYLLDRMGEFIGYQAQDSSLLFAPPSRFLGRRLDDVFPEEHVEVLRPLFDLALKTRQPQTLEYSLEVNGKPHYFEERLMLYDKDNILSLVRDITERKRMEESSRRYSAILWAISLAASEFMQKGFTDDTIQSMLERMGQAAEVSRVYIFENQYQNGEPVTYKLNYEWIAEGVEGRLGNPALEEFSMITMLSSALPEGKVVIRKWSDLSEEERLHFGPQGIKSMLSVPIFEGDKWWGFIGFNECQQERDFAEIEIGALRTAAGIISAAINNKVIDNALRESETRYRGIVEDQMDFISRWNPETMTVTFVNDAFCRFFGGTKKYWIGRCVQENIDTDDVQDAYEYGTQLGIEMSSDMHEHRNINHKGEVRWCQWRDRAILDENGKIVEIQSVGRDIHEAKMRDREQEGIAVIAAALRGVPSRLETLQVIVAKLNELVNASGVAVGFYPDGTNEELTFELGYGDLDVLVGRTLVEEEILDHVLNADSAPNSAYQKLIAESLNSFHVPLLVEEQPIGAVLVVKHRKIDEDEARLLSAVADIAASAVHRATLYDSTQRRLEWLTALRKLNVAVSGDVDLNISLKILLDQVLEHFGASAADVLLVNSKTMAFEHVVGRGFVTEAAEQGVALCRENALAQEALQTRKKVFVQKLSEDKRISRSCQDVIEQEGFITYLCMPLIAKGVAKGVLEVFSCEQQEFEDDWLRFMESLATDAAMAIGHTELFDNLQRSNEELKTAYDETIQGWSRALELRDKETQGHSERVVELTVRLARHMGICEEDMPDLRRGAILHDIGKMGVPDSILLKPSPLSPEEWEMMSKHPAYAYDMLSAIPFLQDALDIPYCHHERWNGSGYPRGLKGEEIPLAARVFSVVDVWDALTSDRPYRAAWLVEQAYKYIQKNSGHLFDPRVVDRFLEMLDEEG